MKTLISKNGKKIKLNQRYDLSDLLELKLESAFFNGISGEFYLPTEVVLRSPKEQAILKQGRIYRTNLYARGDQLYSYSDLAKEKDFKGTYHEDELFILEVWSDIGQSGHVNYQFFGDWSVVCYSDLKAFLDSKGYSEFRGFTLDEEIAEWLLRSDN